MAKEIRYPVRGASPFHGFRAQQNCPFHGFRAQQNKIAPTDGKVIFG
ncbi:hypothetical protein LTSEURB_3418 [Salmonella enterica subsp. enterica serovar Urbana str. R8-2977]|uniref:Uncharacterized protein n=1 Tax=Salmonella enterica subsp. enterica serovar Urbana str. R8-2977 TaxID=913084 RepID=G5RXQ3_SALET|nr:hypothetical protein LTSEURB_3418 [Salmonella enterica subsp. enterica serovar Urbana str. R8-2977]